MPPKLLLKTLRVFRVLGQVPKPKTGHILGASESSAVLPLEHDEYREVLVLTSETLAAIGELRKNNSFMVVPLVSNLGTCLVMLFILEICKQMLAFKGEVKLKVNLYCSKDQEKTQMILTLEVTRQSCSSFSCNILVRRCCTFFWASTCLWKSSTVSNSFWVANLAIQTAFRFSFPANRNVILIIYNGHHIMISIMNNLYWINIIYILYVCNSFLIVKHFNNHRQTQPYRKILKIKITKHRLKNSSFSCLLELEKTFFKIWPKSEKAKYTKSKKQLKEFDPCSSCFSCMECMEE